MAEQPMVSTVRCPRCRARRLELTEILTCGTSWETDDRGRFDLQSGVHEVGESFRVDAVCRSCGRAWRVKKAPTIRSIAAEPAALNPKGAA